MIFFPFIALLMILSIVSFLFCFIAFLNKAYEQPQTLFLISEVIFLVDLTKNKPLFIPDLVFGKQLLKANCKMTRVNFHALINAIPFQ